MAKINRQGVDVSNIAPGDHIIYQFGEGTSPKMALVTVVPTYGGYDGPVTTSGTIAHDYILAVAKKYMPPPPKPIDREWKVEVCNAGYRTMVRISPINVVIRAPGGLVNSDVSKEFAERIVADHNAVLRMKAACSD